MSLKSLIIKRMKKMNIIQFLPYYPPHKWGLETHSEQWGKYWVKNDFWKVYNIITSFNQNYDLWKKIIFKNIIIWYKKDWVENLIIPSFEIINNFPIYKIWSKEYKLIIQYIKKKKIDVVITRTRFFLTSLTWWIFAKKNKIRWIHIEHWSDYVKLNSKFKSFLAFIYDKLFGKWIFKKADKLFGLSNACKIFIQKKFINREVNVIYRWVELQKNNSLKKWDLKLVFIWRLVKLKWVDYLLEVYNKLNINIKLVIIWDWEEKNNLEKFVKLNNLENVEFLWFKDKEFIENFLAKNNCILVNPSYQEWLPTTVIEWLFYKNVVVASNVWWTNEISNKEDLILFEAWNKEQLKDKINFAINNYKNLVWKSKNIILEKFDWDKNILKYYKMFNEE